MTFNVTDANGIDTAELIACDIDMEIGDGTKNDFRLTVAYADYDPTKLVEKGYLYSDGTEYGGRMMDFIEQTSKKTVSFEGDTWRGMLEKKIILPPSGQSYLTVSGDISECLNKLLFGRFGGLFEVDSGLVGVSVSYKVPRYATMLKAMTDMCLSVGYRLDLKAYGSGDSVKCVLSAEPIKDYSEEVEISQDSGINFVLTKCGRKYTHVIAAGSGELLQRLVVFLKVNSDGSLTEISSIPSGPDVVELFFDYPNAEDRDALLRATKDRIKELNKTDSQDASVDNLRDDYEIGDIVAGRSYVTGKTIAEKITQKILKFSNNRLDIEYKAGS